MKKRIARSILGAGLAAALLLAAAGCELYTGISVTWNITDVTAVGPNTARVAYSVQNVGQYDLQGVNLEFGVDTGSGFYHTAWTPDFSLAKGQALYRTFDVTTDGFSPIGATVLSIDMNDPQG